MIYRAFVLTALFILPWQHALAQGAWPKPIQILQKADSSVEQLSTISYSAEHFVIGMLNMGDQLFMSPASTGRVDIERAVADTVFGAKLRISGTQIRSLPKYTDHPIEVTYDGSKVRALDSKKEMAYVNEPDKTGQSLIYLRAGDLLVSEFYSGDGFSDAIASIVCALKGRQL